MEVSKISKAVQITEDNIQGYIDNLDADVKSLFSALQGPSFLLGLVSGVIVLGLIFASVVAHELGHSLVAQRLGIRIAEIELHFFGGAAKMLSMPKTPRDEIVVAGAGPLVSLLLAGVAGLLSLVANPLGLLSTLMWANLMLGIFNLIPALPTDGGRILRAALTPKHGPLEATRIAVKVARVATVGIGIFALVVPEFLMAIGVAIFLWMLGTRELRLAEALYGRPGPGSYNDHFTTPMVDVYDRSGRFVTRAPGGVASEQTVRPQPQPKSPAHSTTTGPRPPHVLRQKQVLVRGPDGRLYVVSQQRGSAWN